MKLKSYTLLIVFGVLSHFTYAQTIETVGVGAHNVPASTLTFSDLGNIDHVLVEAIFKAPAVGIVPNGPVTFSDADETYSVSAIPVEDIYTPNGTDYGAAPHYFQAVFNTVDAGGITLEQFNNLGAVHSFIAYVYRNIDIGVVSYANYDHGFYYHNGVNNPGVYTYPLDMVDYTRDLTARITISEMAYDARVGIITVSAGGITETVTINEPDPLLGAALNILEVTLPDVPGDATELTVTLYSPNNYGGDSFVTGGVVLDVETPIIDCGPCEGQMTSLTLEYQGDENDATVKVYSKKVKPKYLIATFTNVNPGDELSFVGTGKHNKLGSKVRITINGDDDYTEIHTSCSQPIEVGMVFDDFLLVAGTSHEGGDLCEGGGSGGGGSDCGPCEGQMTSLTLEYQGDENDATIEVYTKKVKPENLIATFTNVNPGDELFFEGTGNHNKLGSKVRITINGDDDYTEIHTSCSQPIEVGMVFDDFLLIAGTSHEGGDLCEGGGSGSGGSDCGPCDGQMTALTLDYMGSEINATIKVYKDKVRPDKLLAIFTDVNQGDELSFTGTGKHNKMGAKIRITENNDPNYTEIHTSCSQPIEVGMVFDNKYQILAGTSHEGGELCDDDSKSGTAYFTEVVTNYNYLNAYPNPITNGSTVEFEVAEPGLTVLELLDIQGRVVKQLFNTIAEPGNKYSLLLSGTDLNTGIYILKMTNGSDIKTQKLSIIR